MIVEIKKIGKSDIATVVEIHCASFQNFFLTQLGEGFLRVYYNAFRKCKKGVMLGYYQDGNLLGFCAATEKSAGFNSQLIISDFILFFLQGIKLIFTNYKALIRLYKNSKKVSDEIVNDGQYAELFSIAVSPLCQNLGVGKSLLTQLEIELKARKCEEITLTTDYVSNDNTLNFYNKMGYKILYEFIAYPNRKMYRLIKRL